MDITQPILRGTLVKYNENSRWVAFKYERCLDFYYNCGIIGHGDKSCIKRSLSALSESLQFRPWLKAWGGKIVTNSNKTSANQDYYDRLEKSKIQNSSENLETQGEGNAIGEERRNERIDVTAHADKWDFEKYRDQIGKEK